MRAAALLILCAAASAHDLSCSFAATTTAGDATTCDIELRNGGNQLFGTADDLCDLVSDVELSGTNYTDSGAVAADACAGDAASPFSYRGSTGLFRVTFTPTVAGPMAGDISYIGASGLETVGSISTTVVPAAADPEKLLSSCTYDAGSGTTCTTKTRDAYNNLISQCDQTWSGGGGTCQDVPYTTGDP